VLRDSDRACDCCGSKSVIAVMSAARPLFPHEQTFAGTHRTAVSCHEPLFSRYGIFGRGRVDHSGFMPANFTTLAHFSMSSAMNLPKPADELANAV